MMLNDTVREWIQAKAAQEMTRTRLPLPLYLLNPDDSGEIIERVTVYTPTAQLYRDANACASEMEAGLFIGKIAGHYDSARQEMLNALEDEDGANMVAAATYAARAAVALRVVVELGGASRLMDALWAILQTAKPQGV